MIKNYSSSKEIYRNEMCINPVPHTYHNVSFLNYFFSCSLISKQNKI